MVDDKDDGVVGDDAHVTNVNHDAENSDNIKFR